MTKSVLLSTSIFLMCLPMMASTIGESVECTIPPFEGSPGQSYIGPSPCSLSGATGYSNASASAGVDGLSGYMTLSVSSASNGELLVGGFYTAATAWWTAPTNETETWFVFWQGDGIANASLCDGPVVPYSPTCATLNTFGATWTVSVKAGDVITAIGDTDEGNAYLTGELISEVPTQAPEPATMTLIGLAMLLAAGVDAYKRRAKMG